MKSTTRVVLFLVLAILLSGLQGARAQVAIYKVNFQPTGQSVNYQPYDEGFFVMPLAGGDVSFLLMFQDGLGRKFTQSDDLGTFFSATDGDLSRGVLANADGDGTPLHCFTAVGKLDESVRATVITTDPATNTNSASIVSVKLPGKLTGFMLTADASGNGSAGASTLTASLDAARTQTANLHQQTVDDALQVLVASLVRAGYSQTESGAEASANTNPGNTSANSANGN